MSESAANLAQLNFQAKRRTFQHFLQRVEKDYEQWSEGTELVEAFRTFVILWLHVFAQCSLDPINEPKVVVTNAELSSKQTVPELCSLVQSRLGGSNTVELIKEMNKTAERHIRLVSSNGKALEESDDFTATWLKFSLSWLGCGVRTREKRRDLVQDENEETECIKSAYPVDIRLGFMRMSILSSVHHAALVLSLVGPVVMCIEVQLDKALLAMVA